MKRINRKEVYKQTALGIIQDLTGKSYSTKEELNRQDDRMTQKWYRKWHNSQDLSFYDSEDYLWVALNCYDDWTEINIGRAISFFNRIGYVPKRIVDFGAGLGLGTVQLAEAFPDSEVIYFNIGKHQPNIFKRLVRDLGINNVTIAKEKNVRNVKCDTLIAYEVFEHFYEPLPILRDMVAIEDLKYLALVNSFSTPGSGHFNEYNMDGRIISNKKTNAVFNRELSRHGFISNFKRYGFKFWNDRPKIYERVTDDRTGN